MKKIKASCIAGMIVGIAIFAAGLYMAFGFTHTYYGSYPESAEFGGDYYTYQYKATQNAAANVKNVGDFVEEAAVFGFRAGGFAVAAAGLAVGTFFELKLSEARRREELAANASAAAAQSNPYQNAQPQYAQQSAQAQYYQNPSAQGTTSGYPQYPGRGQNDSM